MTGSFASDRACESAGSVLRPIRELAVIKVAVVEDDPRLREYLRDSIEESANLSCIWTADGLRAARRKLVDIPDVALIDLGLPDGDGSDLIADLRDAGQTKVIVITVFDDRASVMRAIRSGADGYLVKDSLQPEVAAAIESLNNGGAPMSASAAVHMLALAREQNAAHAPSGEPVVVLTPRETELLEVLTRGLSFKEAAGVLNISRHTVDDHMKSIYRKLSVHSRAEAVYEALSQNLIQMNRL
jgi:DNA-binding NarL/FixJ family response regulator